MKKIFVCALYFFLFLQFISVKTVYGFSIKEESQIKHTGFLSFGNQTLYFRSPAFYFNNESTLYNNILSLNQELGFNFHYFSHPTLKQTKIFNSNISISLEPRWYYKKEKRRNIDPHSPVRFSPFLSMKLNALMPLGVTYYFNSENDRFYSNRKVLPNQISLVLPRWGALGHIVNVIYYEFGLGIAYFYNFNADHKTRELTMTRGFLPDLFVRVGARIY